MEDLSLIHKRKSNLKSMEKKPKSIKSLTKLLGTDFDNTKLKLENSNMEILINLLEGKNKILEEHCNLLREKNHYFERRLKDLQADINSMRQSGLSDKDANGEKTFEEENEDEHNQNATSLKDRISGLIFGISLPKFWELIAKIKSKRKVIKAVIEDHGNSEEGPHCPMQKLDFKAKFQNIKVNLFRVVVVIGSLMIISGIGYAGYKVWKTRYRHPAYLIPFEEEEEEDSGEELFRAPGASRSTENILKTNSTDSFETPGISTDFKSILDTVNKT